MYRGGITAYCTSITLAHVYVPEVSQRLKLLSQVGLFLSLHQQTPLHIAASKNYERTVECLVDEGADINIKDNTGVGVILYTTVGTIYFFIRCCSYYFFHCFSAATIRGQCLFHWKAGK